MCSIFSCVRASYDLCARAQLRGNIGSGEWIVVQEIFWHPSSHPSAQFIPVQTNFHPSKRRVDGWLAKCLSQMHSRWQGDWKPRRSTELRLVLPASFSSRPSGRIHFPAWFYRSHLHPNNKCTDSSISRCEMPGLHYNQSFQVIETTRLFKLACHCSLTFDGLP